MDRLVALRTEGDRLVAAVRTADLACFTFVGGIAPRTFWRRRQLHETAAHRADVEGAGGAVTTPAADLAPPTSRSPATTRSSPSGAGSA